ncbi:hypothetical protein LTR48_001436 [Friedmanniomyces endolithicus]|uniref:Hydrophobin n=1 Tax=Rachicladosporium monterosium TaxID=1507873 RepID=A0ABR0L4P6_9PEZI|nr:hypothetical protein LTR48_001436 [Friedmanniomyces endolithicus]KAK5143464.1 hypothetical protein LTR32_004408 [Rachicladosporium monterosium]
MKFTLATFAAFFSIIAATPTTGAGGLPGPPAGKFSHVKQQCQAHQANIRCCNLAGGNNGGNNKYDARPALLSTPSVAVVSATAVPVRTTQPSPSGPPGTGTPTWSTAGQQESGAQEFSSVVGAQSSKTLDVAGVVLVA